jgi:4-amino-4-deoxy-L-arabinose transferase-like glycosyltransferase
MFFGINETIAYDLTAIIGSLSVVLMFFVAYLLYKNERLALYAALFLALTPVHIMWSGTTASEPFLMFFALLAVFCLLLSFEFNSLKMTALSIVSLAYAMQIKAEGIFLLPIVAVFIFFLDRNWMKKLKNYKFLFLWILFFILITPYLIHTIFAEKTDPWGSEGNKFGFEHAKKNIPENLWFWVFGYPTIEHPTLFTILAFFGLMYCLKKESGKCLSIVFWFATFFLIYGFFYAGSVRYGTDVRYALSEYPPLILLAVCGVGALTKFFMKNRINIHAFDILLLAIILLSFYYLYLPSVSTPADKIMEAYGARHYHDFVIENANKLNDNCCILSHVPSIYLVMDKCSLQTWNGQNEVKSEELFSKTNCVIFDDGYWCTLSPYKESVCKYMFDKYELKIIDQFKDTVEQRIYTFYEVSKPKV